MSVRFSSRPEVSVVIPAYNASRFIRQTLDSVLRQTYQHLEVLVIDDGSSDGTADVTAALVEGTPRIRIYRQEHGGVAAARNNGIARAQGQWIAPLDADDVWEEEKIQKQVSAFERGPAGLGLVYTWSRRIDEDGHLLAAKINHSWQGDVFIRLLFDNIVGHGSGPLIRRSCLDQVGNYSTNFFAADAQGCEDWDLYLRLALKFEFAVVPEYLVRYRLARQSMSARHLAMERSFRLMLRNVRTEAPGLPRNLLRWSASSFYFLLASRGRADGSFGFASRLCLRSCALNPVRLLEKRSYRLFLASLLRRFPKADAARPVLLKTEQPGPASTSRKPLYERRQEWLLARGLDWWQRNRPRSLATLAEATCQP